jgi:hypothetical protein
MCACPPAAVLLSRLLRSAKAADCVPDLDGDGDAPFPRPASVQEPALAKANMGVFISIRKVSHISAVTGNLARWIKFPAY